MGWPKSIVQLTLTQSIIEVYKVNSRVRKEVQRC